MDEEFRGRCAICRMSNTPKADSIGLEKVYLATLDGAVMPQPGDVVLSGIVAPNGQTSDVIVDGDALTVEHAGNVLRGVALIGWSLEFHQGGESVEAEITAYADEQDWVNGNPIAVYGLAFFDPVLRSNLNVCGDYGRTETSVTMLVGEIIDSDQKLVLDAGGYLEFACKEHANAKMKKVGYGPNDGYGSTREQRQATLKMLTADYCGTGKAFTKAGQRLMWVDDNALGSWNPLDVELLGPTEAQWDENGALCLDTPRYVSRDVVEQECTIPLCGDDQHNGRVWSTHLHVEEE